MMRPMSTIDEGDPMSNTDSPAGASPQTLITRRAIEDPDFRERLVDDPRSTIAEATGREIRDEIEIVVVENGPTTFHILLPSADLDLSEMDVAGGWACSWACTPRSPLWDTKGCV